MEKGYARVPFLSPGATVHWDNVEYTIDYPVITRNGILLKLCGVDKAVPVEKVSIQFRDIRLTRG